MNNKFGRDEVLCSGQQRTGPPASHDVTKGRGPNRPDPRIGHAASGDLFEVPFDPKRNYLRELKDGQTKKAGA